MKTRFTTICDNRPLPVRFHPRKTWARDAHSWHTVDKSTPRSSLGGRPLFYPKIALYAQQQQAQAAALDFHDDEFFNEESSDEEAELLPEQPSGSFSGEMDLVNSKCSWARSKRVFGFYVWCVASSSLDKDAFENQEDKENTSFDTSISEILPARAPRKSSMLPKGTPLKTLYERPAAEDDQEQIPEQFQNDDDFMLNMDDGYPVDEEVNDEPPADTRRQSLVARRVSFHQSTKMGSDDLEEVYKRLFIVLILIENTSAFNYHVGTGKHELDVCHPFWPARTCRSNKRSRKYTGQNANQSTRQECANASTTSQNVQWFK